MFYVLWFPANTFLYSISNMHNISLLWKSYHRRLESNLNQQADNQLFQIIKQISSQLIIFCIEFLEIVNWSIGQVNWLIS